MLKHFLKLHLYFQTNMVTGQDSSWIVQKVKLRLLYTVAYDSFSQSFVL